MSAPRIAYFCMEYALTDELPIFAGGLGVLAGDHLLSANDLGLDFVAIGLLYREGYFAQTVKDGQQAFDYPHHRPEEQPLEPVVDEAGKRVVVEVPDGDTNFKAQTWLYRVGDVRLFLLDTDFEANDERHRYLTRRLYSGGSETRIRQEVLLGMGGRRLLKALSIEPTVHHMNEGHASFLVAELWAEGLRDGCSREASWVSARERCVFTTHTPVPAGHDRFDRGAVTEVLGSWCEQLGVAPRALLDLGREHAGHWDEHLCMTTLALRGSRQANGVSELHGEVSRNMWKWLRTDIGHITNGVHPRWLAPETCALFDAHLPGWRDQLAEPAFWTAAEQLPTDALIAARDARRARLVARLAEATGVRLDDSCLTLGFARRFAPYKRATLLFRDVDRLAAILDRGAQVVFAGKAHPKDEPGQSLLAEVVRWSQDARFRGKVLFVPGYDLSWGASLTQGCDVWLNNPRRPREASGTSGQKAAINGNPNLSVLDGWWPEAWDGDNGWGVPSDNTLSEPEQDARDADVLYALLEGEVLECFASDEAWARRMAHSIATCLPVFNTHRMVSDYLHQLYTYR